MLRACTTALSITVLCLFAQPAAFAEILYIQAETHFTAKAISENGGQLDATLLDDLNHPVPDMPVEILLTNIDTGMTARRTATTDDAGRISVELALTPGKYQADLVFSGKDAYLAARDSKDLEVSPCLVETSLDFGDAPTYSRDDITHVLWPAGSPIAFSLEADRPACANVPLIYLASFGPNSKRITLKDASPQTISLDSPSTPDEMPLLIERFATENTRAETIRSQVALYTDLIEPSLRYIPSQDAHIIRARILPKYADFPIQASLQIPDLPDFEAQTAEAKDGALTFQIEADLDGCHDVIITPKNADPVSAQVCFVQTRSSHAWFWLPILAALSIAAGILLLAKRRLRPKLPPAPEQSGHAQTVEQWPVHIPAKAQRTVAAGMAEVLCIDEDSRAPINAADVACTLGDKTEHPEHWPYPCPVQKKISITAPGYLPYTGIFNTPGRIVISLKTRRNYVIRCFENAAEYLTGSTNTWGTLTPDALLRDHPGKDFEKFCRAVETAAFGADDITDEQISEIYALMKKLPRR